jgi:hypothetical protein
VVEHLPSKFKTPAPPEGEEERENVVLWNTEEKRIYRMGHVGEHCSYPSTISKRKPQKSKVEMLTDQSEGEARAPVTVLITTPSYWKSPPKQKQCL